MGCASSSIHPEAARQTQTLAAAAAAVVADAPPLELKEDDQMWQKLGGASLEAALAVDEVLGSSPVRLLDARFIIELARGGGTLVRRQDLPEAAFLSLDTLRRLGDGIACLRVIALSHPWLHPHHPDPHGSNLQRLARALALLLAERPLFPGGQTWGGGTYGIFLDFMSLHQKGPHGEERTATEAELFKRALGNMMVRSTASPLHARAIPASSDACVDPLASA
jgi:hypothetical protein